MTIEFPNTPVADDTFTDPARGFNWKFTAGGMWVPEYLPSGYVAPDFGYPYEPDPSNVIWLHDLAASADSEGAFPSYTLQRNVDDPVNSINSGVTLFDKPTYDGPADWNEGAVATASIATRPADMNATDYTFEMWVRYTGSLSSGGQVVFGQISSGAQYHWEWTLDSVGLRFGWRPNGSGSGSQNIYCGRKPGTGGVEYSHDTWHHVVCMKSGGNWYGFLDGVLTQGPIAYNTANSYGSFTMKVAGNTTFDRFTLGRIAETRISREAVYPTAGFDPRTAPFPRAGLV